MAITGINDFVIIEEDDMIYENTVFNESSLQNSVIFQKFDELYNGVNERARALIKNGKIVTNEDIELQYMQIKQYADNFSKAAILAFDSGTLKIVYTDTPGLELSKALPFLSFRRPSTGEYVTYIFINSYASYNKNGKLTINPSNLDVLLKAAYAANRIKTDPSKLRSNQYMQKITKEIYNKLVSRLFMREYGIGADKILTESLQYYINRFFLERVYESTENPEGIEQLSIDNFKYISDIQHDELKNKYNGADIKNFTDLLELIKPLSPRMVSLSLLTFLDRWMVMYYDTSTLAIDNFEYLIFMIISLLSGGNMVSMGAQDVVKEAKNIKMFYQELSKLI